MGTFSQFLETALLEHIVGISNFEMPTCYVALTLTTPTSADTGSTLNEPTDTAYARVATDYTIWNSAVAGTPSTITNSSAITFQQATQDWGTITSFALTDSPTGGNMLAWGTVTTSADVGIGEIAQFNAGDLTISLT